MPRRLFDSPYLFGLHEPGGEQLMIDAGKPGWLLFTEEVGRDPNNFSGKDFTPWSNRNLGVICRINHGYHPNGTIPNSAFYADFARRCANYVANSQGCKIWIIGNETNFDIERPSLVTRALPAAAPPPPSAAAPAVASSSGGIFSALGGVVSSILRGLSGGMGDAELFPSPEPASAAAAKADRDDDPTYHGAPSRFNALHAQPSAAPLPPGSQASPSPSEVITPELYVRCYQLCRDAIHRVPGHSDDLVLVAAVAPWNNQTQYAGNANGDWVQYFQDILRLLGPTGCDGFSLHTYTHGADPNLISDAATMDPPFQNRHFHFLAYCDFMNAVPADMRHLPAFITETDQDVPWLDQNSGWVQRAYGEIDSWNRQPNHQQIRALVLYRWPDIDRWVIETKSQVIADFRAALNHDYRWRETTPPANPGFQAGQQLETTDVVNLRRTPGYLNKAANDVLIGIPAASRVTVLQGAPRSADNLEWWHVRYAPAGQPQQDGWAAKTAPSGVTLLRAAAPPPQGQFAIGSQVRTETTVNLRRTAGYLNKPANDVIVGLPPATVATVGDGPTSADGLTWWLISGSNSDGAFRGWAAEKTSGGDPLLTAASRGVDPQPTPVGSFRIGDTVTTLTIVRLRRTPGFTNKPANDVLADVNQDVRGRVLAGPQQADALMWWQVATTAPSGAAVTGWMAERAPGGALLLEKVTGGGSTQSGAFAIGELVVAADILRVRRTPGVNQKPADDTLGAFEARTTLNIIDGPRMVDGMTWWRVGGITLTAGELIGWVAQALPNGAVLVSKPPKLPGTNIPDRGAGIYLGAPFAGHFGIAQLWGENPQIYSSITYDGVPLKGHNGIDFLTPSGTTLLAVADGSVMAVVDDDGSGFGKYVKLAHPWGESLYAHMESHSVQPGQNVRRGQAIGRSDNTGFSNGPHLHFAIRINPYSRTDGWGGFSDPLPYLNPQDFDLPAYIQDPASGGTRALAAAAPAAAEVHRPIADAPGYLPEKPGVARP